jgi:type II secretory pathway component PulK
MCFLIRLLNSLKGASETALYHGCLALHPASDPRIFVNSDHQSALACVGGISVDTAKKIMEKRQIQQFQSINEFVDWLEKECRVSLDQSQLARLVIP